MKIPIKSYPIMLMLGFIPIVSLYSQHLRYTMRGRFIPLSRLIPGRTFRRIAAASASRRALLWERHQRPPLPWRKIMSWYSFACWPFVQFHDKIDKHPRWKGVEIHFLVYTLIYVDMMKTKVDPLSTSTLSSQLWQWTINRVWMK